jgi:LacI family transcriptional regulator of maltose regulon
LIKRFTDLIFQGVTPTHGCSEKSHHQRCRAGGGVSVSTVSLVLSGKGRISPATGQRVNEAVEQLGFVRNRQASALRGGQSGVIGLIVRDLTSPFYAELTAGLTEALEAQGRMVFLLHGGREADQLLSRLDMLLNQGVDGVIVAGASGVGSELCERAAEKGVPLVFASRASYLDEADTLRPDNMQAAQMLTEHLIRRAISALPGWAAKARP